MKAVAITPSRSVEVTDIPIPRREKGSSLVKVYYAAINPTDWKHVENLPDIAPAGNIVGCDFAGIVEESDTLEKGSRVAGFFHGCHYSTHGAFAEYLYHDDGLLLKVPENITLQEACTVPLTYLTATQAIYTKLGISPSNNTKGTFLVWSGATSVGQYAIQIARNIGLRVITTCSPKNASLLKSFGAEETFDYNSTSVVDDIKRYADDIIYGLDTISAGDSVKKASDCFGPSGGTLITLLGKSRKFTYREDVKITMTLAYTSMGKTFTYVGNSIWEANEEHHQAAISETTQASEWLANGKLIPNKVRAIPGGLNGVKDGFEIMKSGKVSAEKLVIEIVKE